MTGEKPQPAPAKITAPKTGRAFVRPRLFERFDRARQDARLVWVVGVAGAGKTTLAASYVQARGLKSLWYQLDEGDADAASFFYYMGAAARSLAPRRRALPLFTPAHLGAATVFARRFFRQLFARFRDKPGILVLDDYQDLPPDAALHALLAVACEETPPGLTVLVLSREAPPSAFARLYANAAATMIDAAELRLTLEETRGIVALHAKGPLDETAFESLHRHTDGWAAGLILMLNQPQAVSGALPGDGLRPPQVIFDYFAAEVLLRTDEGARDFLLRSALLPTMTVAAAHELTGNTRAAQILRNLARRNYFTVRHKGEIPTYEYHPLFRTFLLAQARERFSPDVLGDLQRRAVSICMQAGQVEYAAELLRKAGDTDTLIGLIETSAPALAAQGRLVTLDNWLGALPPERFEGRPWLSYWLGHCRMSCDLSEARRCFEQAYAQFGRDGQALGMYLAWAGITTTYQYGWGDFTGLDHWVDELRALQRSHPLELCPEAVPHVICAALGTFSFARPDDPEVPRLAGLAEAWLGKTRGSSLHIMIASALHIYHGWIGDLARLRETEQELTQCLGDSGLEPLARLYGYLALSGTGWLTGDLAMTRKWACRGLEYGEEHGIGMFRPVFHAQLDYVCQLENDPAGAAEHVEQMRRYTRPERQLDMGHYCYHAAWLALERGEPARARELMTQSLASAERLEARFSVALSRIKLAEVWTVCGDYPSVPSLLDEVEGFAAHMGSSLLQFMAGLVRAFALLRAGHHDECAEVLSAALDLGHRRGYMAYPNWHGRHITELCAFALERGIEVGYVRGIIQERGLLPPPGRPVPEGWPFPVRIHTLGRFAVLKDRPLRFGRKAQRKPFELLKALVALGGRDVPEEALGEALWPETDGDLARQNLKAAVHRLRRLIGVETVVVRQGRISLDPCHCWVDLWALERRLSRLLGPEPAPFASLETEVDAVIRLYRGPFLQEEEAAWVLAPRERLRGRFVRAIDRAAKALCEHKACEQSLKCYEKAADIDPLSERLTQGLMRRHQCLNRPADGLLAYARFKHLLEATLGIAPSRETEALAASLRGKQS
jgi:LuxR family transcriptional regulator, maltose regulon positive regulatory protein